MRKLYNGDMSDCGLPRWEDLLSSVEPTPLPPVGKVAVGGMTTNFPTGLEFETPRRFSLLGKSAGEDHPASHRFRRGEKLCHKKSGAGCTFVRDASGLAEVTYGDGDIARHTYSELESADRRKAIAAAALAKSSGGFRVGDRVIMLPDGDRGEIVKLRHGVADVRCNSGTATVLVQSLRPADGRTAGAISKSRAMPPGAPVWVRLPGSSREVRASLVSYDADRLVVQFADGTQSVITPEQCRTIDEAMLQNPMTVIGRQGNDYRLIPNGPSGLIQAPKAAGVFSLLKGVKPFTQATSIGAGGDGSMADCGL